MDIAQVKVLTSLINSSVAQLESVQASINEKPETETRYEFLKPAQELLAAASQLIALVRTPEWYLMDTASSFHLSSALRAAVETHVAEVLREYGKGLKKALSTKEIGELNHVNPAKLGRVLRLLATHHIFEEVSPNVFANNINSLPIDTGRALSEIQANEVEKYDGSNGMAALIGLLSHHSMYNAQFLADTLKDPKTTNSYDAYDAPFARAWGKGAHIHMFEWLNLPENVMDRKRYQVAMHGWNQLTPEDSILRGFDFSALPDGAVIVDCGGGIGSLTMPILKAVPHVHLIVQDTEAVVAEGHTFWNKIYPEALTQNRVTLQAHNLFYPQPALNNRAAVFILRMVLHSWPDAECLQILQRLRECIGDNKDARLLLVEDIVLYASREQEVEGQEIGVTDEDAFAPEPLLANWGVANSLAYKQDMTMLCNHNACERTLPDFGALLQQTGFRIVKVYSAHQSWLPQVVAVPV